MRTRLFIIGSVAGLLMLPGCRKGPDPNEIAARGKPQDPNLSVQASGYHGNHFSGPVYLPRSSPMESGTTAYSVTYQDGVTVMSRADTLHHLLAIRRDGNYVFDSSASQIANLQPGSVLLLSGLALFTVVDVKDMGDGYLVKTGPAKITDAIKSGRLEGTYRIDFSRMQAEKPSSSHEGAADFDVDFGGYNYHVKFTPGKDRIDVQATLKFGGSQGTLAYEGVGYLSNFVSHVKMQITDGQITNLRFTNSDLRGQVELKWFAVATEELKPGSTAKITSWPAELLKSVPLTKAAYHIPILVGALPFDLRISLGFSFIPAFTSKNSVSEGSKLVKYSGDGGFVFSWGQTMPAGVINVQGEVAGQDNRVVAAGPVGFTAAIEAPRVELVMGWPPSPMLAAGYLNAITSYGIVTNGMGSPHPCQTNIMAFSVNAGSAHTSPNTFADWFGTATGVTSSVTLWQKTTKAAGAVGLMCPS
jgi:hypothetical protein